MRLRKEPMIYAIVLFIASLTVNCNNNGGTTTIVNQGLDCGLVRDDLIGKWTVNLGTGIPTLQNCTGVLPPPLPDGTVVSTNDFPADYAPMDVFGSDGSTSFKLNADRFDAKNDTAVSPEFTGSVQADSCLAMVRVWDTTDKLFYQCIGTFDRQNRTLPAFCDSVEIDLNNDGQLDTSCSLSTIVTLDSAITTFP